MQTHCPEVKIYRGNAMITLEGPDNQVHSGATKLGDLMKKVAEKRMKLPTDLMVFIKSSDAISKYQAHFQQSLKKTVFLEAVSDLVLFSLSSGALDEAEAAIMRDLSVDTVKLQGAAAIPPGLDSVKEILIKTKDLVNSRRFRVDVSFIPGLTGTTEVRLVGYSENVNKLKEVLHDYQMNHIRTQETLNLSPELVDCFDKVLDLIGMKQTKVTLNASHFPCACVSISGPRCLVQESKATLSTALASLTSDTLILEGPGAQRYFQSDGKVSKELVESSCHVLITEQQKVDSPDVNTLPLTTSLNRPSLSITGGCCSMEVNTINLAIKLCSLIDEQVDVLVVPMINKKLTSTKIGADLLRKAGDAVRINFDQMAARCNVVPGDVLEVDGSRSLSCSKIYFIECLPWDGVRGQSVQALGNGLRKCLDLCVQQGWCSVAFPVIGPGRVLKYPLTEAIQVLNENIRQFGLSTSSGSLSNIHIVIKPDYPDSECYHEVYLSFSMTQGGQVTFRSLSSDLDDINMTVGGRVKLQLVFGNIINEKTDAIVNITDFTDFVTDSLCKDILNVAGPDVATILRNAKVKRGDVYKTPPGSFPCKAILHVHGEYYAGAIEQLMCRIIQHCEAFQYKSVAIPAICAGTGGLDPGVVASAMLRGLNTAMSTTALHCLTNIRLVLININAFLVFKKQAMQLFPHKEIKTDLSFLQTSSTSQQQSIFNFLGLCKKNVDDAMKKLKDLYLTQCSTHTFTKEQLESLTQNNMKDLKQLVETVGLSIQWDQSGSLTVRGLEDRVRQMIQMIHTISNIRREMTVREEEEDLYTHVAWCIQQHSGNWEKLPKIAHRKLESSDVNEEILDARGIPWSVDLKRMEAKRRVTGQSAKLKRLNNLPDLTLPLYWDNMATGENLKVVTLQPSSPEYQTVEKAFKQTVTQTVMKIERLQNVHLLRAYQAQKKNMSDKNVHCGGAGEKLLYHGTAKNNCIPIMKNGFNRSFAGCNGTLYGDGTYFAVNASLSVGYSSPAHDGSRSMFVVRVLTGVYDAGHKSMKVPPPRSYQQPHDLYDSVVDQIHQPDLYVVFQDNQAYPDYLITFS
uniref:poly [ADP-ribose] polymerase 14-like isoform X1 n=1 Tax=Monopterus albus TaxID=43700 RepID=UPI0009B3C6CB|nr:poly [ADP-ribose] polymerase 14-like isoform X1 [Monopterus albus]